MYIYRQTSICQMPSPADFYTTRQLLKNCYGFDIVLGFTLVVGLALVLQS